MEAAAAWNELERASGLDESSATTERHHKVKQVKPPEVIQGPWKYNFKKGGRLMEIKKKGFTSLETETKM